MARQADYNCNWMIWHQGHTKPMSWRGRNSPRKRIVGFRSIRESIAIPVKLACQPEKHAASTSVNAPVCPERFSWGLHREECAFLNSDGSPAAGRRVTVRYRDAHLGGLEVFSGQTSRSGECEIRGIADREPESPTWATYGIAVDEQGLGDFSFTKGKSNEAFTFHFAAASERRHAGH